MEKFQLDYLHIADSASIDQFGKVSIYGIFEKIILEKIPGKLLKFVIVGSIKFGRKIGENINLKVKIVNPNGKELRMKPISVNFPIKEEANKKGGRIGFTIEVGNLEFKKIGKYKVILYVNKKKIEVKRLTVVKRSS